MDMVFGDIRKFINDDVLRNHDKIFVEGHISLFRNTDEMNNLFRERGAYPEYNYQEAYSTNAACYFDEYRGMELKCLRKGVRLYNETRTRRDYSPTCNRFCYGGSLEICRWKEGRLYAINKQGREEELVYAHMRKRTMKSAITSGDRDFVVVPGMILPYEEARRREYFAASSGGRWYKYVWYAGRIRGLLKHNTIAGILRGRKRMRECAALREMLVKCKAE